MSGRRFLSYTLVLTALAIPSSLLWAEDESQLPPEVAEVLTAFEHEPSIRQVQRAARHHAFPDAPPSRAWRRRARWSNAVPTVEGTLGHREDDEDETRFREDLALGDRGRLRREQTRNRLLGEEGTRRTYSLSVEWELGGLVYDREEIAIAREMRYRRDERADVVRRATNLYYERRKKQILALVVSTDDWRRWLELQIEIDRNTAELDALTGGWFTDRLNTKGGRP